MKKDLQKKRIMIYFIDATNLIIEKEGLDAVTIRKVADLAGYNSATIYNYFKNLDHLILFASIKYLKEYIKDLSKNIESTNKTLKNYLIIWKYFCIHSFKNPKIYNLIFCSKFSDSIDGVMNIYYNLFPNELPKSSLCLNSMLLNSNIFDRNLTILKESLVNYSLSDDDFNYLNEMIILLYEGMLKKMLISNYDVEERVMSMIIYIKKILSSFNILTDIDYR